MSKYTTEIRYICETKSGFSESELKNKTVDQIIAASRSAIFNFQYPIYDQQHKPELETKILKHYYTREIGSETFGLWQLQLNAALNDIMPKYNRLYAWEEEILNKELLNIDITKTYERVDNLTKTSDHTRTDNLLDSSDFTRTDNLTDASDVTRTDNLAHSDTTRDKYSDTPQGTITNLDNDSYLTDYRNISTSGSNTGTQRTIGSNDHTGTQRNAGSNEHTGTQRNAGSDRNTGTQTITETEYGYRGEKINAFLLAEYAERVLNIDLMIINELSDLFIKLW